MIKSKYIIVLLFTALISNVSAKKLSKTDLSSMFSDSPFTDFAAWIYHSSSDSSTVYMNVELNDLSYRQESGANAHADFRVGYSIWENYEARNPIDSSSLIFSDDSHYQQEMEIIINFNIPVPEGADYLLMLRLTDMNKPENSRFEFFNIHKSSGLTAQNFLLTDADHYPLLNSIIPENGKFYVQYNQADTQQLYIRYYHQQFPLARPPFSIEKDITYSFEPDSFYSIALTQGKSFLLELPFAGIYHFQADLFKPEGLTLYRYDEGFPEVSTPAAALAPLRYLSSENEFKHLLAYTDYKVAVDSFWLERSSQQPDRARNMIKRYYSRVEEVNRMFSSFQEGWKTDRGIIYIVFGPPSEVYRDNDEEEWIYGERGNPLSIRFYFYKTDNPFSDNDYSLMRSPAYKTSWYIAIENWRR